MIINTLGKHYYNKTAQGKILQDQKKKQKKKTNRMSNNTTKTEMVEEMKLSYKEKKCWRRKKLMVKESELCNK